MRIRQRAVSVSLLTLLLLLVSTALASCGNAGATSGKLCTVYAVYLSMRCI